MKPPILLFAAGLGTRMKHLTKDQPKPLVNVAGKPLIDHALDLVTDAALDRKVVNIHYKGAMLKSHLAGRGIVFSDESDALLETGGGLRRALPLLGQNPVLTMNTDAVWRGDNPISHLIEHWHPDMEALLLLVNKDNVIGHHGKGDFAIGPQGRLHRAAEMIYTGVQILRTDVLNEIEDDVFSMNVVWDKLEARGGLFGATYNGQWCDVGQPSSIPLAEAMLDV